jgi:hypothetical protein
MLHPEYKYIDFAIGGPQNRNNVTTFDDAVTRIHSSHIKEEVHICIYRYNYDLLIHFGEKDSSVAGYRGSCFADYIWIDIDRKDSPEQSLQDCRKIFMMLKQMDASKHSRVYFSGSKGFHLAIPIEYIKGIKPHKDLPVILGFFASRLCGDVEIDKDLYRHLNLLRLQNTVNKKSGLYKIRISEEELENLSIQEIKELARNPRTLEENIDEITENESLTAIYRDALKDYDEFADRRSRQSSVEKQDVDEVPNNRKLCIWKLWRQGAEEGHRHKSMLRLAVHYKQEGFAENEVYAMIVEWHKKNDNTHVTEREIGSSIAGIFRGEYDYGCFDPIKDHYCDKRCFLYPAKMKLEVQDHNKLKREIEMDKYISDVNILFKSYEKLVHSTEWISINPWLPSMGKSIRGYIGGIIVFWLAYTGVGKSAIKDNFNRHIIVPSLNYELEQSRPVLIERKLQNALELKSSGIEGLVKNNHHEEIEKGLKVFKHIYTVDQPGMSVKDIEEYYWYFCASWLPKFLGKPEIPVKVPLINVDNLGDVEGGKGGNVYEKVSDKVRSLRLLARKLNVTVQVYAHIRRDNADDGRKEPTLGSAKDTSVIENIGDIIFGAWRPNYLKDGDNELYIKNLKNRMGPAGTKVACELIKDHMTIREQKANQGLKEYGKQMNMYEGEEDPF